VKDPVSIAALVSHSGEYVGKTVQVKGKITEVCQMMGCWMMLTNDDGQKVRIKVNDGDIVFPKDAAGKQAVAQAKGEAEESGRKFDSASVKAAVIQ
jgi:hypothetical protein